jgi:RNA polymerase sigma factor (sigma-70 family)
MTDADFVASLLTPQVAGYLGTLSRANPKTIADVRRGAEDSTCRATLWAADLSSAQLWYLYSEERHEWAFEATYHELYKSLCSVARRMRSRHVDDDVQETFRRAVVADFTMRGPRVEGWFCQILRSVVVSRWRATSKEVQMGDSPPGDWEAGAIGDDMGYRKMEEEKWATVQRCLRALTPDDQRILRLYYEDGLRVREIAGVTGKTVNSLNVRICRLRETIRLCVSGSKTKGQSA